MAWIYLAESEESRKLLVLGSELLPTVKTTDMRNPYFCPACGVGRWTEGQYGTTCGLCGGIAYTNPLTSLAEDFPVRTSALSELEKAWEESKAVYFSKSQGLWGKFDLALFTWKTCRRSLLAEGSKSSVSLPPWGMTVDGECFQLMTWEHRTKGSGGGVWPTPRTSQDFKPIRKKTPQEKSRKHGIQICGYIGTRWPHLIGKYLHAGLLEKLMGYREGSTALEPWAIVWFRNVRKKRSKD